jgi:hypothetical protein
MKGGTGRGNTLTGGSQTIRPSGTEAEGESYQPNATGSINEAARLSRTDKTLDPGRLWGATADAMHRAEFYKQQRLATNKQLASISEANAKFYGKQGR